MTEATACLQTLVERVPARITRPTEQIQKARIALFSGALKDDYILIRTPAGHRLTLGLPMYQEVRLAAYARMEEPYLNQMDENGDAPYEDVVHCPHLTCSLMQKGAWHLQGEYSQEPQLKAGCPAGFRLLISPTGEGMKVALFLYGKQANRKPEALFLPFATEGALNLRLQKIGGWIDPLQCAEGGNSRVHGVEAFQWQEEEGGGIRVTCLHAPLIAIGAPKMLEFEGVTTTDRVYSNLYNNLWGTNFKMWYEEDIFCEYLIQEF